MNEGTTCCVINTLVACQLFSMHQAFTTSHSDAGYWHWRDGINGEAHPFQRELTDRLS